MAKGKQDITVMDPKQHMLRPCPDKTVMDPKQYMLRPLKIGMLIWPYV
jgi:hypothetical protein